MCMTAITGYHWFQIVAFMQPGLGLLGAVTVVSGRSLDCFEWPV
jgi:hypothetical protein